MRAISLQKMDPQAALESAVKTLLGNGIVAYPTETYYALGVRFDTGEALAQLYAIKGRSELKAVPLIISGQEMLPQVAAQVSAHARRLMDTYWPGPLTLLLPARPGLPGYVAVDGKVAVREPGDSFALELARATGFPITSTSANPSGQMAATNARMVVDYFPRKLDLVVDGGETPGGLPSTIVDMTEGAVRIVREGACALAPEDLMP